MNCEIHQLAPLRCEAFQAKEVMRAVLHTVLFTRALGVVRPRDVDCEMFDLSYATCGDPAVDAAVEARLDALQAWLRRETRAGGETHARVTLSFHELQHVGPGTQRIEKRPTACWEQWRVPLEVVVVDEAHAREELREQLALELRDTLRGAIQHVLGLAGERKTTSRQSPRRARCVSRLQSAEASRRKKMSREKARWGRSRSCSSTPRRRPCSARKQTRKDEDGPCAWRVSRANDPRSREETGDAFVTENDRTDVVVSSRYVKNYVAT